MTYSVRVTKQVEDLLAALAREEKARARELALVLLRLKKNPEPEDSRPLDQSIESGGRVWRYAGYELVYKVDKEKKAVLVGVVRITAVT